MRSAFRRDLMQSFADVLPVYRYTVDAVFNFAKQQSWLEGVAATYATEGRMWKRYTPKAEHKEEGLLNEGEALLTALRHFLRMRCFFFTCTATPTTSTATSTRRS